MSTTMIDVTQSPVLSQSQLDFFSREGYLPAEGIFTADDLQPVIDEISAQVDRLAREAVAEGTLSQTYADLDFDHRLAAISRETPLVAKRLWNVGVVLPSFFDLMRTPRLLDAVEQICGPELIASSVYRLRPKVPTHSQSAVPWHQDSGYFEPFCDKRLVLTVWLPLVDADEENGCMWVQPRQHRSGLFAHRQANGQPYLEIDPGALPAVDAVCCPIKKGGVLFLSNLTPHASFQNKTDRVRWSMDLRYQSAALPTNAAITRLPGEIVGTPDASGPDGAPIACYPPEPDFLVRSHARPTEVLQSREAFLELRRKHIGQPITNRWNAHWDSDGFTEK